MLELHVGNVLTKIIGDIPSSVKIAIREQCAYSIKGAEFSAFGSKTYCPFCKKMTQILSWEEKKSCPNDGLTYRRCLTHGLVVPISLWDGRKFLFDSRSENFPTGIISRVVSALKEYGVPYKIVDERLVPYTRRLTWHGPELRYYQKEAVETLIKKSRGIIHASTGVGKTMLLAHLTAEVGVNTLVLAHTTAVFHQLHNTFQKCLGIPIGRIGDGYKDIKKITVAIPQAIVGSIKVPKRKLVSGRWKEVMTNVQVIKDEYKDLMLNTEALFVDECFPGQTLVHTDHGLVSLHQLVSKKLPYKVLSFNGNTFEYKPIVRYMCNKSPKKFIRLEFSNCHHNNLLATYNHKVYICDVNTGKTFCKRMDEIEVGDFVVKKPRMDSRIHNVTPLPNKQQSSVLLGLALGDGSIQKTSGSYRMRLVHRDAQLEYLKWKISILDNLISGEPYKSISGYTGKKTINALNTRILPTLKPLYQIKDPSNLKKALQNLDALALAIWFMDDGTGYNSGASISTHSFSYECNLVFKDVLKTRFDIDATVAEDKRVHKYFLNLTAAGARKLYNTIQAYVPPSMQYKLPEEYRGKFDFKLEKFNEFGVAEVTATGSADGPTDIVYNIEVADNHNYLVKTGILVSNCHRSAADTVQLVANSCVNAYFRVGVSATPYRADLLDILIESVTGKVAYKYMATRAIHDGYLSKPVIHLVKFKQAPYPKKKLVDGKLTNVKYADLYQERVTKNNQRNLLIANIAYKHYIKNESVLVIVRHLEHGQLLYEKLKYLGKDVRWVNGENDTKELKKVLEDLNNGTCKLCIASGIFNEGIDVAGLNVCINTTACDSPVTAMQILGRTLRRTTSKNKVDFYDIYDYGVRWLGEHAENRLEMYQTEPAFEILSENAEKYLTE